MQGGDLQTYINAIHPHALLASGKPVYDGYLLKSPAAPTRINQCARLRLQTILAVRFERPTSP
jgi:hypothetical protein